MQEITAHSKFFCSVSVIGIMLLMNFTQLPDESESSNLGWTLYGIIIGLLLSVAIRAFYKIRKQSAQRRYRSYSR